MALSMSGCSRGDGGGTTPAVADNELFLDGLDDRAEAAASVFPNPGQFKSFTFEAWIFPTVSPTYIATTGAYFVAVDYLPDEENSGIGVTVVIQEATCSGYASVDVSEFRDVKLSQWNHVAFMVDVSAKQLVISINGILGSPHDFTQDAFCNTSSNPFTVGGFHGRSDFTFGGRIDEVRISNSVRYTTDFSPSPTLGADGNTKGLWHFDEPVGSTLFSDSSGNGYALAGVNGAHIVEEGGQAAIDVTGAWKGTWASSGGVYEGNLAVVLAQNGSSITGTASITGSLCVGSGSVSGTVSGNNVAFGVVSGQDNILFDASYTSQSISGYYLIIGGSCVGDTGTFSMSKSSE